MLPRNDPVASPTPAAHINVEWVVGHQSDRPFVARGQPYCRPFTVSVACADAKVRNLEGVVRYFKNRRRSLLEGAGDEENDLSCGHVKTTPFVKVAPQGH
jgi:hypothetical protein